MSSTKSEHLPHTEAKDTDPDCRTDKIKNIYNPHWSNQRTVTYTDEYDPELQEETRRKAKIARDCIKKGFANRNKNLSQEVLDNIKEVTERIDREYKEKTDAIRKKYDTLWPPEKYTSYTELIANIVISLEEPDTVIGKRKIDEDDLVNTLIQLNPIIINKQNIAARSIYTELIMERPNWPRWMKKWAAINADPIHSIINNNASNKHIFNILHKVMKKLSSHSHMAIMNQTSKTTKRITKVHRSPNKLVCIKPTLTITSVIKQRRMARPIANRIKLIMEHYKYHHAGETWFKREPLEYERKDHSTDKVKNAAGLMAINSRRETWKRRKRKANC
jgi:hypothetical protein